MPLRESAHIPRCTYRVQLHGKFHLRRPRSGSRPISANWGFRIFICRPIFTAVPGSLHGYDVNDYGEVNPELGGAGRISTAWRARLRAAAAASSSTSCPTTWASRACSTNGGATCWSAGVIPPTRGSSTSNGKRSMIEDHPRVLLPVLEDHFGRVLEQGKICAGLRRGILLRYGETSLPVRPESYRRSCSNRSARRPDDRRALAEPAADRRRFPPAPGSARKRRGGAMDRPQGATRRRSWRPIPRCRSAWPPFCTG